MLAAKSKVANSGRGLLPRGKRHAGAAVAPSSPHSPASDRLSAVRRQPPSWVSSLYASPKTPRMWLSRTSRWES